MKRKIEFVAWNKKTGTGYTSVDVIRNTGLADVTTAKTTRPYIVKEESLTYENPKETNSPTRK